jgi:hypothetical protein
VSKRIIECTLNEKDIDRAIKELKAYKQEFLRKEKQLLEGLAEIGIKEASVRFTTAMYDGTNDVSVHLDETKNGYVIVAEGKAVAFIEFGAGVYHNTSEPYPDPRPTGIVGIGEYGKGMGKRKAWGYKNENDEVVITRGNPAAMPMWYASEEIKNSVLRIAKEVFGT